jgi:hypothetical protein
LRRLEILSEVVDCKYVNKMGNLWKRNTNPSCWLEILVAIRFTDSKGLLTWTDADTLKIRFEQKIYVLGQGLGASFEMMCQSVIYTDKYYS